MIWSPTLCARMQAHVCRALMLTRWWSISTWFLHMNWLSRKSSVSLSAGWSCPCASLSYSRSIESENSILSPTSSPICSLLSFTWMKRFKSVVMSMSGPPKHLLNQVKNSSASSCSSLPVLVVLECLSPHQICRCIRFFCGWIGLFCRKCKVRGWIYRALVQT